MKNSVKARPKSKARRPASRTSPKSVELRTPDSGPRTLIIGYGNPLRGDDGFGWHASRCLIPALVGHDVEILTCHQLTPELAEPLSRCALAIFVDADCQGSPGQIRQRTVRVPAHEAAAFTHTCTPSGLLANAKKLYGARPRGVAITVSAETFAYDEKLSPVVTAALPKVIEQVRRLVQYS